MDQLEEQLAGPTKVAESVTAQLKFEINGDELNKSERLILQQKFGLVNASDIEIDWYLNEVSTRG